MVTHGAQDQAAALRPCNQVQETHQEAYGTMYGMVKTTVYLPDELKAALSRVAAERAISEAELIREALRDKVSAATAARPRVGLFAEGLGDKAAAERVDDLLAGFGR